jgi:hypothetical protein
LRPAVLEHFRYVIAVDLVVVAGIHRAQFEHREKPPVTAQPLLPEQARAR